MLYAVSYTDRDVFSLLLDTIGRSLNINDFQISLLSGFAFSAFYASFGMLFGWATDRSRRRGLVWSACSSGRSRQPGVVWQAASFNWHSRALRWAPAKLRSIPRPIR